MILPTKGRLLGIDYGAVRLGLAICDPDRILASPLDTLTRKDASSDAAELARRIRDHQIVGLVLGLPISLNGSEGPKAQETRQFANWLREVTRLPLVFMDERFTTAVAEDALIASGVRRDKRQGKRDRIAAQLILQAYLDSPQSAIE